MSRRVARFTPSTPASGKCRKQGQFGCMMLKPFEGPIVNSASLNSLNWTLPPLTKGILAVSRGAKQTASQE